MSIERTLSIIKPDATLKNVSGEIISILEKNDFKIIAQKRVQLSNKKAEEFYVVHSEKPFFQELTEFMSSSEIVVQVLESENAIKKYRKIMGSTNPAEAEKETIRAKFGDSIQCNAVHGSDSEENANTEISFFFSGLEIIS